MEYEKVKKNTRFAVIWISSPPLANIGRFSTYQEKKDLREKERIASIAVLADGGAELISKKQKSMVVFFILFLRTWTS